MSWRRFAGNSSALHFDLTDAFISRDEHSKRISFKITHSRSSAKVILQSWGIVFLYLTEKRDHCVCTRIDIWICSKWNEYFSVPINLGKSAVSKEMSFCKPLLFRYRGEISEVHGDGLHGVSCASRRLQRVHHHHHLPTRHRQRSAHVQLGTRERRLRLLLHLSRRWIRRIQVYTLQESVFSGCPASASAACMSYQTPQSIPQKYTPQNSHALIIWHTKRTSMLLIT